MEKDIHRYNMAAVTFQYNKETNKVTFMKRTFGMGLHRTDRLFFDGEGLDNLREAVELAIKIRDEKGGEKS